MHKSSSLALIVAGAVLLSACSSPVQQGAPAVKQPAAPAAAATNARDVRPVAAGSVDPLNDPQGALAKRSVYFDYDSYLVREDGKPVVERHASFLSKNKSRKILIQGNSDERGGSEYNLALGQKRAEAVRKALRALGVDDSQIEAVSLGETKPKASGGGEAAWAQNRRADIVY